MTELETLVAKAETEEHPSQTLRQAIALLGPDTDRDLVMALYNRCCDIIVPLDRPSTCDIPAWGTFARALLDTISPPDTL